MTDPGVADVVYLEPLTVASVERILEIERPDGLLASLGGQTGLNLAMEVSRAGVLERTGTRLLGTPIEAIEMAEDRERFRDLLDRIGQPYAPSVIVEGQDDAERAAAAERALETIGLPAIVRPAFTLGGTGGGIVTTPAAYQERVRAGLRLSPIGQVMVERYLSGWQEIEYEVMRDAADTCIAVCSMENVDPLGVHTGDSIVVAPVQTLPDPVHQRLRTAALDIIRALGVEGGCNVQFALSPDASEYAVIEVNPRVSRSSALASKATGYPIARVAAQIAIGRRLDEIPNAITGTTVAAFEPALDYVVVKLPRFPFDKFPGADRTLGSQMKATGEVMAIDRTFGAALNKALRGLEQAGAGFLAEDPAWGPTLEVLAAGSPAAARGSLPPIPLAAERSDPIDELLVDATGLLTEDGPGALATSRAGLLQRFLQPSDSRLWRLLALLRRGVAAAELQRVTGIAPWFLSEMERLAELERRLREAGDRLSDGLLVAAKRASFSDRDIGTLTGPRRGRGPAGDDTPWGCGRASPWSTPAPRSSPPRRPTSTPPTRRPARRRRRRRCRARRRSSSAPARCASARASSSTTARCRPRGRCAPTARRPSWSTPTRRRSPPTSTPRRGSTSSRWTRRACWRSSTRSPRTRATPAGARPVRRADAAQPGGRPVGGRRAAAGSRPRGHRAHRGAHALRPAGRPAGHPAAAGRHGDLAGGGARRGGGGRLPGARAAVVRHRRAGHRLLLTGRRTWSASWRPPRS